MKRKATKVRIETPHFVHVEKHSEALLKIMTLVALAAMKHSKHSIIAQVVQFRGFIVNFWKISRIERESRSEKWYILEYLLEYRYWFSSVSFCHMFCNAAHLFTEKYKISCLIAISKSFKVIKQFEIYGFKTFLVATRLGGLLASHCENPLRFPVISSAYLY